MSTVNDLSGSATVNTSPVSHKGCFVMWQMLPEKWLIELVGGGHKISAGRENRIELAMLLWSYFCVVFTDPGVVPPSWRPASDEEQQQESVIR
ncbi:hypothetical protein Bca52824_006062 [Brassica carinata]|uniref:Uncharacterized protein n=1 Tax=Brassica carinata TaxID=52824 RepID=A0A8X8BGR6_BRACI|nr:hypothetical protein Bca52824_006062 [Brassica carinata]